MINRSSKYLETMKMKGWSYSWCIIIALVCLNEALSYENANRCTDRQYYNSEFKSCVNCSKCPTNLILRQDCTNTSDTVCGRFSEFDRFHEIRYEEKDDSSLSVEIDESSDIFENRHGFDDSRIEIEEMQPTKSSEDQYWKNLAFALIGVLCVLIILATLVVWYVCRKLQASVQFKRSDDDEEDADNGYVVIRSMRNIVPPQTVQTAPSRVSNNYQLLRQQRLVRPYRPKRRLLNEYADDVFESEDSGGSKTSRRMLSSIPEQSDTETATSSLNNTPKV